MGKLLTVAFVFAIAGGMLYFYNSPLLLPDITQVQRILPENVKETVDDASKKIADGVENEFSKATADYKPKFDSKRIEQLILEYTNDERVFYELKSLEPDSELAKVARGHSSDMAQREYFAHQTPEGLSPTDRAKKADYSCVKFYGIYYTDGVAENLAQNWLYNSYRMKGNYMSYNWHTEETLAKEMVDGWMDSPGHRKNMLHEDFDKLGVGVVIAENDAVYATQNFC